jgi:hypothetical protein
MKEIILDDLSIDEIMQLVNKAHDLREWGSLYVAARHLSVVAQRYEIAAVMESKAHLMKKKKG